MKNSIGKFVSYVAIGVASFVVSNTAFAGNLCPSQNPTPPDKLATLSKILFRQDIGTSCDYLGGSYDIGGLQVHPGIDFPAPRGTQIYSATDGTVKYTNSSNGHVAVSLADGRLVNYYHMDTVAVSVGATLTAGVTQVGTVGTKGGVSTGNHLHIEVRKNYTGTSAMAGASCSGGYCTSSQIGSMTDNPISLITSVLDGTGSLIDPRKEGYGCGQKYDYGCSKDTVILHSHPTLSTGFFQVMGMRGYCESIRLTTGDPAYGTDLKAAEIEMRPWKGGSSIFYKVSGFPATIPLQNKDLGWNVIAVTTTAPIPVGGSREITASCSPNTQQSSNVTNNSAGTTVNFGNDNYWGGNGSIIGFSNSQASNGASGGFGRTKDSISLSNSKKTISAIQITPETCKNITFQTPVSLTVSQKPWSSSTWSNTRTVYNGTVMDIPSSLGSYAVLKIEAPVANGSAPEITISCP